MFQKKLLDQPVKMKLRLKRDNDFHKQVAMTDETSNKNNIKQLTSVAESFDETKKVTLKCNIKKTDHTNEDCVKKLTEVFTKDLQEKSETTEEQLLSEFTEVVPLLHTCEDPIKSKTTSDKIQLRETSSDCGRDLLADSNINDKEVDSKNSITTSKDQILKIVGKNITTDPKVKITCKKKEINDNCKINLLAKEKTEEGASSSNDIYNTDMGLNEMFMRLYNEESATVSDKEKVKSLPGLSYIIIFTGTKMKKNMLTFDCVLCNPSIGRILSGRVLKTHLRNRNHLLNILKLHDYSLFKKYQDKTTVTPDVLYKEASNCELNTEKQVVFTVAQTYSDKRKKICSTIARLSGVSMKIYESKLRTEIKDLDENDENTSGNLQKFCSPILNSLNFDLQSPAELLVEKQKNRQPKRIVFVLDVDYVQFETKQFGELVTVERIDNLNFLNAVEKFQNSDLLGKGCLFIICCGIYSLLNVSVVSICKVHNCPNPLKIYSVDRNMSSDILMSKALELQAYILTNTTDDLVMFCDIIPINISNRVMKTCGNKHSLRNDTPQDIYINYLNIIEEYNKFIDNHCELYGFKNLNLLNMLFPLESNTVTRPLDYLYDYGQVDTERVSYSTNEYFYEFLKKMGIQMQDISVVSASTAQKKHKITESKFLQRILKNASKKLADNKVKTQTESVSSTAEITTLSNVPKKIKISLGSAAAVVSAIPPITKTKSILSTTATAAVSCKSKALSNSSTTPTAAVSADPPKTKTLDSSATATSVVSLMTKSKSSLVTTADTVAFTVSSKPKTATKLLTTETTKVSAFHSRTKTESVLSTSKITAISPVAVRTKTPVLSATATTAVAAVPGKTKATSMVAMSATTTHAVHVRTSTAMHSSTPTVESIVSRNIKPKVISVTHETTIAASSTSPAAVSANLLNNKATSSSSTDTITSIVASASSTSPAAVSANLLNKATSNSSTDITTSIIASSSSTSPTAVSANLLHNKATSNSPTTTTTITNTTTTNIVASASSTTSSVRKTLASSSTTASVSSVPPKATTPVTKSEETTMESNVMAFQRVVLITNPQYAIYMEKFKGPKVQVLSVNSDNVNNIALTIKQIRHHRDFLSYRTLWLSHPDVFKVFRTERSEMCSTCAKGLNIIVPDKEQLPTFADYVPKIQSCFEALIQDVNSFLDSDSAFAILPPVPLTLLVLDNIKHDLYHKIDGRRKLCHFTTAGALTEFQSLYSKLNKQMIAFSLSEFTKRNITMQPIADYARIVDSWSSYLDVVTYGEVLKFSKETLNKKFCRWFEHINTIISESLKPESKESRAARYLQYKKDNNAKKNTPKVFPKTKVCTNPNDYDHIVLICFCQEHSQLLSEEERKAKNISVILMSNTLDWNEVKKELQDLVSHDCHDILFVIIGSMYLLGSEFRENFCRKEKCTDSLYYIQLALIDTKDIVKNIMRSLRKFAFTIQTLFKGRSTVIFTPLLNIKCAHKPFISYAFQHESVHKLFVDTNNPCLLKGGTERWSKLSHWFQHSWANEMFLQFYDQLDEARVRHFKNMINKFNEKSIPTLYWIELHESSAITDSKYYNTECKLFLRQFLDVACPSLINKKMKAVCCTRPVLQANTKALSRPGIYVRSDFNTNTEIDISQKPDSLYKMNSEFPSAAYSELPTTPYAVQENVNVTDSSECFYNNDWKDLVTFGSQSSLRYLVEAIRGLKKFPPYQKAKVLYISSSSKFLSVIRSLVFNILSSTGENVVNLAVLEEISINSDLYDVFMGTPHILANFHWDILSRNDIRALIVDDVMKVLASAEERIIMTSIFRRMRLSENSAINKVFVAEFYQTCIPEYLTSLFGVPLIEVKPADSQPAEDHGFKGQNSPVNIGYPGISSQVASGYSDYSTINSLIASGYPGDNRVASEYTTVNNQIESGYPTISTHVASGQSAVSTHVASGHLAVTGQRDIGYPAASSQQDIGYPAASSQQDIGYPAASSQQSSYSCSISDLENQLSLQYSQHPSTYRISSPNQYKYRSRSPTVYKRFRRRGSRSLSRNRRSRESRSLSRNRRSRSLSRNRRSRSLSRNRGSRSISHRRSLSQYRSAVSYSMRRGRSRSRSAAIRSRSRSRRQGSHLNSRGDRLRSRSGIRSSQNILRSSQSRGSPSSFRYKRMRSRSRSMDHRPLSRSKRFRSRSHSENYGSLFQGKRFCSRSRSINRSVSRDAIQGRFYVSERNSCDDSKSSESKSRDSQSSGQESSSTIHGFSVTGALDLLLQVNDKLGMLGPIVETLSNSIKLELESNRNKALNIIKEAENIIIFNMVVDKLKTLLLIASLDEISTISKSIEWTTHLMEYAKKNSQQEVNINVRAIAAASMNQTPSFTLNLIKTAFVYEGKENPTTEEINAMFLQVCSLQFEMAVEDN